MAKKPSLEDLEKKGSDPKSEEKVKESFESYYEKQKSRFSFFHELEEMYDWFVSGKMSNKDKAILIGSLLYFINPVDFIPDITPFLGFSDDFAVLLMAYRYLKKQSKKDSE